ncbi:ABC transporter ATP-binding protein [Pseudochelatococcus sp. B33]
MRIDASGLSVAAQRTRILDGLSFSLDGGELVGLIGPNGAGKSTLLKALAGLVAADSGSLLIDGTPIGAIDRRTLARTLAYLPQNGPAHWGLSVEAVVRLGRLPHRGRSSGGEAPDAAAVDRAMQATGIADLRRRAIDTLSGGERMRALLARALAVEAPVLLADEPVAALDPRHQLLTMALLRGMARAGRLVVAVLHDLSLACRFCDRLLLLREGAIVADGPWREALSDANIAAAYGVSVHRGAFENIDYIIPWKPT